MTTALISDLHLGQLRGTDLLRRRFVRESLFAALEGVDDLVLLGDIVELREGPMPAALAAARPFFEELGEAMGGRRVVLVPGNHDHRLLSAWLERRRTIEAPPLGLAERVAPEQASEPAAMLADWLGPAITFDVAYPGLWVRDDVYATHGHYLDRHVTVPGFEPLGIRLVERMLRRGGAARPGAEGYEAVLGPVYSLLHELAQGAGPGTARGTGASHRVYRMLTSDGMRRPLAHRVVGGIAYPAAITAVNAVGLGPVRADLSGPELRRAGLLAFGETLRRLGVSATHVVFGHTHRAGPLPHDDGSEWVQAGARVVNAGSWVHEPFYLGPDAARSPYWPGNLVVVGEAGPPELRRLLADRTRAELAGG